MKLNKSKLNVGIYNCIVNKHIFLKINNKFGLVQFNSV